jgi:hypothetical protein
MVHFVRVSHSLVDLRMRSATLTSLAVMTFACGGGRGYLASNAKELGRHRSPNGKVDAVLYLTPTDPLSSDVQTVRLEPVGAKGDWHGIVARAEHIDGRLGMQWLSDTLLEITYQSGHIYDFDNQWWTYQFSPKKDDPYFVELLLKKQPQ